MELVVDGVDSLDSQVGILLQTLMGDQAVEFRMLEVFILAVHSNFLLAILVELMLISSSWVPDTRSN